MGKQSTLERLQLSAERRAAAIEIRRRDLRRRWPDVSPSAFNNLGDGLGGDGGRALREWLDTISKAVLICNKPIKSRTTI